MSDMFPLLCSALLSKQLQKPSEDFRLTVIIADLFFFFLFLSCSDDSMGYQYPFTLRVVGKDGNSCAWCPWYRFCRGCTIECTEDRASVGNAYIAVDWDPTALHLRYQTSQERIVEEHCSVEQSRRAQAEPISLDSCLKAFTSEEELGEDELYYCSKCKTHRLATKKLDLWRLPPILIVHLKRFQFVNGRWIKSQKIVKFPRENFDPSAFLAPRDLEHRSLHSRSESEDLLRVGEDNLSSISAPAGFCNLPKASPTSSRRSTPSLSRNSSPSGSPKSGGRRPGRLRLPQLGSKHRLSISKENLDGDASSEADSRDSVPQTEVEAGVTGAAGLVCSGDQMASESSCGTEASSSHCEVIVMNGDSNGMGSDCSIESNVDPDSSLLQHRDMCLDPLYNLYAISVSSKITFTVIYVVNKCFLLMNKFLIGYLFFFIFSVSFRNHGRGPLCDICQKPQRQVVLLQ
ncbi:hypothetical protein GOODEAATRI_028201 [Goodea atripinnis]|uniref:ubiquitinyl hydrolase 1 n=1 Tax=Goodea atripinnis TaxID=208336 RepID=A0ABV0MLD1_9TELE